MEPRRLMSSLTTLSSHDMGDHGHDHEHEHGRRDAQDVFVQANLVSDGGPPSETASNIDPHLKNPWGIAFNPEGFWWVSDNHSHVSTLYDQNGVLSPPGTPLVVSIPSPTNPLGGGSPDGIVFNGGDGFVVSANGKSGPSRFLFATEEGAIAGWSPGVDFTHAIMAVPPSASEPVYKGLTLATTKNGDMLFAADFKNGKVDVFDDKFAPAHLGSRAFSDRHIPDGFNPFNVMNLNGRIYVAYAKRGEDNDEVVGSGLGFVDVYDTRGRLVRRLASGGPLNAPWGMAQAPDNFGHFGGDVLVGNFGDGRIMAFDREGHFDGYLRGADHKPIEIEGLWGIGFGNGKQAGPTDTLFFAAGTNDEANGLFGSLTLKPGTTRRD